ncbi:GldL-related protein [Hymenobacter negativus]|uniref:Gliding motility protein GldL-like N-terminal domain-containing protein n=1 Tax=Hymenobacter negativus TaxID=2795026 RepID=A0ABS0Q5B8_9BACT|nr:hypothetical protein [Hymenobacter negativus]MBH8557856.1 hypothetical protein [Hymenobacter negativus]
MEVRVESKSFLYDVLLPKLEPASWVLAIWGFIASWNQLAGGDVFLIIGLANLALVYYLSAYKPRSLTNTHGPNFESVASQQQILNTSQDTSFLLDTLAPKLIGISGAVVLIGTLFKLLFWSGSAIMLTVGTATMVLVVLLMALNQRLNRRAVVLAAIGIIMLTVSSETLMRQLHRDDPQLVELMVYQIHHPHDRAAADAVRIHINRKRIQR